MQSKKKKQHTHTQRTTKEMLIDTITICDATVVEQQKKISRCNF